MFFTFLIGHCIWSQELHAAEVITGKITIYGGFIYYAASGATWIAPCESAKQTIKNDTKIECVRRGYTNSELIGDSIVVSSGNLSASNPEHQPYIDDGHKMFCTAQATRKCY